MKTLKRDDGTSPTPEVDDSVKAPVGDHKTHDRGGDNTLRRENGAYLTSVRDKRSIHGLWNERFTFLTRNGDDNTHLATSKSYKRAGEENWTDN